jgi:hypothetical protein
MAMAIRLFRRRMHDGANTQRVAARGTLQLMVAETCVMGCGYLTVIMLARGLGPHAYGLYGSIMSVWWASNSSDDWGSPRRWGNSAWRTIPRLQHWNKPGWPSAS